MSEENTPIDNSIVRPDDSDKVSADEEASTVGDVPSADEIVSDIYDATVESSAKSPPGVDSVLKNKVEAVLFVTDKPLHAQAIARIINADVQLVRQATLELINQYESNQTALEIAQDNGYIIEIKPEYASIMQEFLPLDIPTSLLRTLSAIAIRAPVAQSEIVLMRGAGAYDHIRELVERELIHKKEEGRSPILSTTKKFQQYFRLSSDGSELRSYVKQQEKILAAQKEAQAKAAAEAAAEAESAPSSESAPKSDSEGSIDIITKPAATKPTADSPANLQDFTPDTTDSINSGVET